MNRLIFSALLLLSLSLVGGALAKGTPTTIGVEEIVPGMLGYGLSVFKGTEPERFDVEVIDVLKDFRPAQDLILIRTPHPILDRARGVGGMSGSPIYLDGRLAGAYAYGWPYGTDPIVGVTPIANMLAEMVRPVRSKTFPGRAPLSRLLKKQAIPTRDRFANLPPFRGESEVTAFSSLRAHQEQVTANIGPVGLAATQTPIMLGGLNDSVAQMLGTELEGLGLVPTQAGGSSSARIRGADRFVNGGAIAVELARGDISVNGIGTVTHVDRSGRVIAFGHPMLNAGEIAIPTATARVLHILVSEQRSFKIAESLTPLGTLIHDRQAAIVIDSKREASRIPVRLRVHGAEGAPKTEWNVEVASHRLLSPMLTFTVIANAIKTTVADVGDVIYRAKSRVGVEGRGVIELEDYGFVTSGPSSPNLLASLRMFSLMEAAFGNPFETSRITSVELDLTLQFNREIFQVVDASVSHEVVDPGTTIPLYVRLRRFDHRDVVKTFQVRIPHAAAGKVVRVAIQPGNRVRVSQPRARSLDDLIERVKSGYAATSLVVSLQMPSRGLQFEGHVVDSLPASALDTLQVASASPAGRPFVTKEYQELPLGQVVVGAAQLTLRVRKIAREEPRGE